MPNGFYPVVSFPKLQMWFVTVYIFSLSIGEFPCQRATTLAVVKIFLEKIPTWICPWNCIMIGKQVLLAILWDRSVRFGMFYNICIVLFILNLLDWWKETNGIVKTQLAKFTETLNLAWPKAFPLVFLNLKVIPFGKHKLSAFEIIAGRHMHLALSVLQLIKNDML